jgi:hypothetical protein
LGEDTGLVERVVWLRRPSNTDLDDHYQAVLARIVFNGGHHHLS